MAAKEGYPRACQPVLVSGGLAIWTGERWMSRTLGYGDRVIHWKVRWWAPLLEDPPENAVFVDGHVPCPVCHAKGMVFGVCYNCKSTGVIDPLAGLANPFSDLPILADPAGGAA